MWAKVGARKNVSKEEERLGTVKEEYVTRAAEREGHSHCRGVARVREGRGGNLQLHCQTQRKPKRQRSPVVGPKLEGYPRPQARWIRFQMRLGRRATRKSPALQILQVQAFKLGISVVRATAILICLTRSRHRCQLAPDLRSGHTRSSTWPGQFGLDFTLSEISSASCSVGGESGGGGLGGWRGLGAKVWKTWELAQETH